MNSNLKVWPDAGARGQVKVSLSRGYLCIQQINKVPDAKTWSTIFCESFSGGEYPWGQSQLLSGSLKVNKVNTDKMPEPFVVDLV